MPHHSGGDNATKVRRRSTCKNSFRDIFLHDPFAHHLKHAFRSKCYWKTHQKTVWCQSFLQLFLHVLECPTTNNQRSRFLCDVPQMSKISPVFWLTFFFSVCWTHCAPKLFYVFPRLFSVFLFSFSFEKKNLLRRTEHSSQWTQALKKMTSSLLSSSRLWLLSAEEKEDYKHTIGYTHNWRFVKKDDEHVAPC